MQGNITACTLSRWGAIIDILSRYILSSKTLGFFQSGISSRNVFNIQCYDNSAFSMKLSVENCIRNWKIMNYNKAIISCHSKIWVYNFK